MEKVLLETKKFNYIGVRDLIEILTELEHRYSNLQIVKETPLELNIVEIKDGERLIELK